MDETLELIARVGTDDPPSDDELASARAELVDLLKDTLAAEDRDLAAAHELRSAIDSIDGERKARAEKAEAETAAAEKLLEGLDEVVDETPVEEPDDEDEEEDEVEAVKEEVAVAASIDPVKLTDAVHKAQQTRSRVQANAVPKHLYDVKVRATDGQGFHLGNEATLDDVAVMFSRDASSVRGTGKQALVRVEKEYPQSRILGKQMPENTRLIDSVMAPQAIAAAGGICGPLEADFNHPICGDRGRPIRDALPQFAADRGGIRYAPTASIGDLTTAITLWDIATDESPGEDTKACLVVDCEDEIEVKVDAVVACLQIGNFQARFNPEFWRSRLDLLMVEHDRVAEISLNTQITALSTAVTYAGADGTIYSVLSAIDKATAGIRSRYRLVRSTRFQAIIPQWIYDAFRSDFAKQRLSGSVDPLLTTDQLVSNLFSNRGVNVIVSPDLDLFGAQGAGALVDYPGANTVITVFPVGTFMFLDGGTYDLGTEITDSTLNATNDRQAFVETFEKVAKRGCESLSITVPIAEVCQCSEELVVTSA